MDVDPYSGLLNITRDGKLLCYWKELLSAWERSKFASPNLRQEVNSGDRGKIWAHLWEAALFKYFCDRNVNFSTSRRTKKGQNGPEFGLKDGPRTIWVEAVVPSPEGIPREWLEPPKDGDFPVGSFPADEIRLRWMSALHDKNEQYKKRLRDKVVQCHDPYVIAINSCRLSLYSCDEFGVSQLPLAVEAVLHVGAPKVPYTAERGRNSEHLFAVNLSEPQPSELLEIPKRRKDGRWTKIPTSHFLNPDFSGISALIGCSQKPMPDENLQLCVVHNPLATNRIPLGRIPATREYDIEDIGDSYRLKRAR